MLPGGQVGNVSQGGGGGYSFVATLSLLTIGHASLSRSTVRIPNRDAASISALIALLPIYYGVHSKRFILLSFLLPLWPSVSTLYHIYYPGGGGG